MVKGLVVVKATLTTSEELREVYGDIRFLFECYPREAEDIRRLALEVKTGIEATDPLIQEMTSEVCPHCKSSNCTNLNGRFDWCDLIYLAALGLELPPFRDGLRDEEPCQFLAERGCILTRTMRPHRCNWWYCEPLLEVIEKWPPRKQRRFISSIEKITLTRKRMCDELKTIQDGVRKAG
ncbi:MAG: hypothetical protein QME44_08745 [Thermodesulfobacteriota bacterium]|nr:hypothetical protein [Thermodesulfobacteriota bacterium]